MGENLLGLLGFALIIICAGGLVATAAGATVGVLVAGLLAGMLLAWFAVMGDS